MSHDDATGEERHATWSIDADRHDRFVEISGDRNPLHVDPVVARRLAFGRIAVHGVHLALMAAEQALADRPDEATPSRISATFRRSVTPGDPLRSRIRSEPITTTVSVFTDVWRVADVAVEFAGPTPSASAPPPASTSKATATDDEPRRWTLAELEGAVGVGGDLTLPDDPTEAAQAFPALAAAVGDAAVAELVALSGLVGMQVPGLHSLFSSFDVRIGPGSGTAEPTWTIDRVDERFSRVELDVDGAWVRGRVTAFVRPEPVAPTPGAVSPEPDAFAGQRWLVVGGSRGLGAVATMLLDAGGAEVCATHLGSPDAAHELIAGLRMARTVRFDVDRPADGLAAATCDGWAPTHLAWFASPPIFDGAADAWSDRLHARFVEVYVDRFCEVVGALDPSRLTGVLWPSSTAVESPVRGLAEYAVAKQRGEAACHHLRNDHAELIVSMPRFPRLATDQTASVMPVDNAEPAPAVLAALAPFAATAG
ncbi:MAG: MaoC/PaaZ C-terminal domain-containing protein [Actinomycetota bacterium]